MASPSGASQALFASESVNYSVTAENARRFLATFATKLALSPDFVTAAYETRSTTSGARLASRKLASDDARLDDAAEGARLARLADKGAMPSPVYFLPSPDRANTHWQAAPGSSPRTLLSLAG